MDVQPTNLQQLCDAVSGNKISQECFQHFVEANKVACECRLPSLVKLVGLAIFSKPARLKKKKTFPIYFYLIFVKKK